MTDEPENLTLVLLREMRSEQERLASMLGKVTDAVTQIAATQEHHGEVLSRHSELLSQILETQQSYGGRLNVIDGRLALIERHAGMVKA
jgi:septation ring formation regulator EzrA